MSSTQKNSSTGSSGPKLPTELIAVMIPTRGTLFTKTVLATIRELSPYPHAYFMTTDLPLPDSRNGLIETAINSNIPFTHYLLVDDDVILPEGALRAMLDLDTEIAVIDYPTHWMGSSNEAKTGNIAYEQYDVKTGEHNDVIAWGGLGAVLVRSYVFKKLRKPWFRLGGRMFERDKEGHIVLNSVVQNPKGGEDFEFYFDCRREGFEIKQVPNMVAGHAKIMRHIGVMSNGKYQSQHDIVIAEEIERPIK